MDKIRRKKKDIERARSALSVSDVDYYLNLPVSCPTSPAASTLTLTSGKIRNIDQDMEHLKASRQDNPFIQKIIASRESLLETSVLEDSDNTTLMSKELSLDLEIDPLSLPEVHEHMIRSPPPVHWSRSPNFRNFEFPTNDDNLLLKINQTKEKSKAESWNETMSGGCFSKSFKAHYYHDKLALLATGNSHQSTEENVCLMGEE